MLKLLPLRAVIAFLAALALAILPSSLAADAAESPAYIAIGDSLAFGVGAMDPATGSYPAIVHDSLRRSERYSDRGLDLVNLAVPGATSFDLLLPDGQVDTAVAEIQGRQEDETSSAEVEIITVNIGGNDVLALGFSGSPCLADPLSSDCQALFREMLIDLEANLTEVIERLREAAPEAEIVVLDLYSPFSGRGGAAEIIADFAIREINDVTERVVARPEFDAKLASVFDFFRGRAAQLVAADNVHPNDLGHALMAEAVLAALEEREPVLPEELMTPSAVDEAIGPPLGEGGLLPLQQSDDSGGLGMPMLIALVVPAAILGAAAVAGAYLLARGRQPR